MEVLEIRTEVIELCKALKLGGTISSGGLAKSEIAAGRVLVNGEVETRKRKKISPGDIISYGAETFRVDFNKDS